MLRALTTKLIRHPGLAVTLALLASAPMAVASARLFSDVRADIKALLPESASSVQTLETLESRFGGWSQLSIVVTSPDREANRRFSDDLAAELSKLESVRSVRNRLGADREFFEARRHLFVDLPDLEEIEERIAEAARHAKKKANPLLVDLEDEAPPDLDFSDLLAKYDHRLELAHRFPNDYFEAADGSAIAVILRQRGLAFGIEKNRALVARVQETVAQLGPAKYHPELVVGLGGDVKNVIEEQESLVEDLTLASIVVFVMLALVVVLYYRRFRSLLLISVPLWVGCTFTFGISHFLIGYLNASSAFLGPIVPGNGINFGLILLARYLEERRAGRSTEESVQAAVKHTSEATSTAALAASIAYGSLMATDFLGFKHFGVIGGIGMVLCWVSTFLVLPPLIVLAERWWPIEGRKDRLRLYESGALARLPALFVERHAKTLAWAGALIGVAAVAVTITFLTDPLEKDFQSLRSTAAKERGAAYWEAKVDDIFGRYLAPQAIILDDIADVEPAVEHLKKAIEAEGELSPITEVSSLSSFVPKDQEEKLEVLKRIRKLLSDDVLAALDEKDRAQALEHRPPADLEAFTVEDLPESVRADFRELDGREGLVVLALPNLKLNLYHADEIRRVAALLRDIPLPDGRRVESSGNFVIYSDMLDAVAHDGPRATLYSFFGVLILCVVAYRRPKRVALVVSPLLLGVALLFAGLGLFDLKINFLNFIALPITFGIGVDYAVNIFSRYLIERESAETAPAVRAALESTGGAVVLCSLTTIIGYGSLLLARNGALVSFGKVAVLGELTCLLAALLIMPAWIIVADRKR